MSPLSDGRLEWNRLAPKQWECFDIVHHGPRFAFRGCHGTYVTVGSSGGLMCNAKGINERELFDVRCVGEN
jgi:hypothetical protein